jgi:hypothetical protein
MLTDAQKEIVIQMWNDNRTSRDIANEVSTTRNAILGFVHRNRKTCAARSVVPPKDKTPRKRMRPPAKDRSEAQPEQPVYQRYIAREAAWLPLPTSEPVAFVDHRAGRCKWPLGDPLDLDVFRFCGAVSGEASYCAGHAELSRPRPKMERESA